MRLIRNAWAILMVSQGVPMVLMGDEMGRSQRGNNNTYCQDNELNWLDWGLAEKNAGLLRFARTMIAFRKAHPALRCRHHLSNRDYVGSGYADISWHGTRSWNADWSAESRTLAFMLCGRHAKSGTACDDYIYVAMNSHWENHAFEIPMPPPGVGKWRVAVNTGMASPEDIFSPGCEPALDDQGYFLVSAYSVVVLVTR
jgi:glycogen operon protein